MKAINVYTDGASKGNPGPGGAGVVIVFPDGRKARIGEPLGPGCTNNRAELMAVSIALAELRAETAPLVIHTDSQTVIGWLSGTTRVNQHKELVDATRSAMAQRATAPKFVKVVGHAGHALNEEADKMASDAAKGTRVRQGGQQPQAAPNADAGAPQGQSGGNGVGVPFAQIVELLERFDLYTLGTVADRLGVPRHCLAQLMDENQQHATPQKRLAATCRRFVAEERSAA